jgi:prepilin-type N-terminal cleavage/methylation domain-containing protein
MVRQGGRSVRVRKAEESGFTLIEVLVAVTLFGVLVVLAVGPYASYRAGQQHIGTTRELVAFLRRAQVRAVSEETTYRVDFATNGRSAQVFRFNGATYDAAQTLETPSSKITYTGGSFAQPGGGNGTSVWFYARGSGSKGSVTVARQGSSKTYTIDVEGLTARVSYE